MSNRAPRRLRREARTVDLMIRMYCHALHPTGDVPAGRHAQGGRVPRDHGRRAHGRGDHRAGSLCPDCASLLDYSLARIEACRFGTDKPVCAHCRVHCFRPAMREPIRAAMRYSGPRMTLRHPYLALRHLLDRRRTPNAA